MSGQHLYKQRREFAPRGETAEVQRALFHWPAVMRMAPDPWAQRFAQSIWRQSARPGWHPSPKQAELIRKMTRELFVAGKDLEVIED